MKIFLILFTGIIVATGNLDAAGPSAGVTAGRLCDRVEVGVHPAGAPKASDVIVRSLRIRPVNSADSQDTMRALGDFHATTLAWAYINDPAFIARVKASGRVFGGAASAPSYSGNQSDQDWMRHVGILDRQGNLIIAPWKRTWGQPTLWGCINNPQLERGYVKYLQQYVDAGAQIMQRDEPGANENAVSWGGCFCDYCMAGFQRYLRQHVTPEQRRQLGVEPLEEFSYRDHLNEIDAPVGDAFGRWEGGLLKELFLTFQKESTVAFHRRTRQAIDDYAGRHVPFSCNNGVRRWDDVEQQFDWAFGELAYSHATAHDLYHAMRQAAAHHRQQIVTMPKKGDQNALDEWVHRTRQTIAMAYACGGHCMVPWDVYMPGDAPRYFGEPSQYADLFAFIRANAVLFDGYEQAEASGYGVPADEHAASTAVRLIGGDRVSVNVRAIPQDRTAPVVIHLVDWAERPEPFTLTLSPVCFFGDQPLRIRLLRPAAFDQAAHNDAEESGDYSTLSETLLLAEGRFVSVRVPALQPWAMIVVETAEEGTEGIWQPAIWAEPDSYFHGQLSVRLACESPGIKIHYTLAGGTVDRQSPVYTTPLVLNASARIQAVAFTETAAGPDAVAHFTKIEATSHSLVPDAASLRDTLQLWLRGDTLASQRGDHVPVTRWEAAAGPAAVLPKQRLPNGAAAAPPSFVRQGINGHAVVLFDGIDDQLSVAGFANEYLAGSAWTLFLVSRSSSPDFGICGNGLTGSGGDPRLYLTRSIYRYDDLHDGLAPKVPGGQVAISVFAHDGAETIAAWVNGHMQGQRSDRPVVESFGSGGNLAMPFWGGNQNQTGEIAEIIVYNRFLSDFERRGVEVWLADQYEIPIRRWR